MSDFPPLDKAKLAKVLALLDSSHDGEVLAAARRAVEMVKRSGASWDAVVGTADPVAVGLPEVVTPLTQEGARASKMIQHLLKMATMGLLPDQTKTFIVSVSTHWTRRRRLSRKQFDALARVYDQHANASY